MSRVAVQVSIDEELYEEIQRRLDQPRASIRAERRLDQDDVNVTTPEGDDVEQYLEFGLYTFKHGDGFAP